MEKEKEWQGGRGCRGLGFWERFTRHWNSRCPPRAEPPIFLPDLIADFPRSTVSWKKTSLKANYNQLYSEAPLAAFAASSWPDYAVWVGHVCPFADSRFDSLLPCLFPLRNIPSFSISCTGLPLWYRIYTTRELQNNVLAPFPRSSKPSLETPASPFITHGLGCGNQAEKRLSIRRKEGGLVTISPSIM